MTFTIAPFNALQLITQLNNRQYSSSLYLLLLEKLLVRSTTLHCCVITKNARGNELPTKSQVDLARLCLFMFDLLGVVFQVYIISQDGKPNKTTIFM
jgi:hypothetical protein